MVNSNEPSQNEPDPQFIELLRAITGLDNVTDAELTKPILRPTIQNTYILYIVQYALLSVIGVAANCWTIYYISKHKLYRDNTHAFFINLSICHFVQSAFVVPVTLVTTIVHNWILGTFMCYFVPMLQVSAMAIYLWTFQFNLANVQRINLFIFMWFPFEVSNSSAVKKIKKSAVEKEKCAVMNEKFDISFR